MNERQLKYLYDIKLAIDEINLFFAISQKYFWNIKVNIVLKRAIERNLEIIGEALKFPLIMQGGLLD